MKCMKGHEGFPTFFLHVLRALHGENFLAQKTRNALGRYYIGHYFIVEAYYMHLYVVSKANLLSQQLSWARMPIEITIDSAIEMP